METTWNNFSAGDIGKSLFLLSIIIANYLAERNKTKANSRPPNRLKAASSSGYSEFDENGQLIDLPKKKGKKSKKTDDGDSITNFDFNMWVESMATANNSNEGWDAAKIRANEENLLDCIIIGAGLR